jgi:hypothetical protein
MSTKTKKQGLDEDNQMKPSDEEEKVDALTESKKTTPDDASRTAELKPPPTVDGVDNSELLEATVKLKTPTVPKPESNPINGIPRNPEVPDSVAVDPQPRIGVSVSSLNVNVVEEDLPFRSDVPSSFGTPVLLNTTKGVNVVLDASSYDGPKISSEFGNARERKMAFIKLRREVIAKYIGIYRDMKDEINKFDYKNKFTIESQIGAKLLPLLRNNDLPQPDYVAARDVAIKMETVKIKGDSIEAKRFSKMYDALQQPAEKLLCDELNAHVAKHLIFDPTDPVRGIRRRREFFTLFNTKERFLSPIPPDVELEYYYATHSLQHGSPAADKFIGDNRLMFLALVDTVRVIIDNEFTTPFQDVTLTFTDVIQSLGVRVGEHSTKSSIAAKMTGAKAFEFANNYLLTAVMLEGVRLSFSRDIKVYNDETVFDAICLKLLTPSYFYTIDTRYKINNVLAIHLITRTEGYSARFPIDMDAAARGTIDYLKLMFDTPGAIKADIAKELRPFLYDDDAGSGWLNAGKLEFKSMRQVADSAVFLNQRNGGVLHPYLVDSAFTEDSVVIQFERFRMFFDKIQKTKTLQFGRPSRRGVEDTLVTLCEMLIKSETNISDMVHFMQHRINTLSLVSICRPEDPRAAMLTSRRLIKEIEVLPMMAASMIKFVKFGDLPPFFFEPSLVRYGWAVREYIEEWLFWWQYAKNTFTSTEMSRSAKLEFAFENAKTETGFDKVLSTTILGSPLVDALRAPSQNLLNTRWDDQMMIAQKFIDSNQSWMGFSTEFCFDPKPDRRSDHVYGIEYRARNVMPAVTLNEDDLRRHLHNKTMSATLGAHVRSGARIRFSIPILRRDELFSGIIDFKTTPHSLIKKLMDSWIRMSVFSTSPCIVSFARRSGLDMPILARSPMIQNGLHHPLKTTAWTSLSLLLFSIQRWSPFNHTSSDLTPLHSP